MPYLKDLYLSGNVQIDQGGAVPLIRSLKVHNSLEKLELYNSRLILVGDWPLSKLHKIGIGVEDCQALSELLSSTTSLRELNIAGNELPLEAVELIITGLSHNATLVSLDMAGSHFSLPNTISLASQLKINHTLRHLKICACNIDPKGA